MAEELPQLLEKIQRDGVEKANAEAAAIVAKAGMRAKTVVADGCLYVTFTSGGTTIIIR